MGRTRRGGRRRQSRHRRTDVQTHTSVSKNLEGRLLGETHLEAVWKELQSNTAALDRSLDSLSSNPPTVLPDALEHVLGQRLTRRRLPTFQLPQKVHV